MPVAHPRPRFLPPGRPAAFSPTPGFRLHHLPVSGQWATNAIYSASSKWVLVPVTSPPMPVPLPPCFPRRRWSEVSCVPPARRSWLRERDGAVAGTGPPCARVRSGRRHRASCRASAVAESPKTLHKGSHMSASAAPFSIFPAANRSQKKRQKLEVPTRVRRKHSGSLRGDVQVAYLSGEAACRGSARAQSASDQAGRLADGGRGAESGDSLNAENTHRHRH